MISNVLAAAFGERARPNRVRVVAALAYVLVVTALFAKSLLTLMAHAVANSLHSHIPLVPAIAVYLLYTQPQLRHVALFTALVSLSSGTLYTARQLSQTTFMVRSW